MMARGPLDSARQDDTEEGARLGTSCLQVDTAHFAFDLLPSAPTGVGADWTHANALPGKLSERKSPHQRNSILLPFRDEPAPAPSRNNGHANVRPPRTAHFGGARRPRCVQLGFLFMGPSSSWAEYALKLLPIQLALMTHNKVPPRDLARRCTLSFDSFENMAAAHPRASERARLQPAAARREDVIGNN